MLLRPIIPVVDMYISTADCGLADLYEDFAHFRFGYGDLHKGQAFTCFGLDKGVHHFSHNNCLRISLYEFIY